MSLNKFTDGNVLKGYMNINCNTIRAENLSLKSGEYVALESKVSLPNMNGTDNMASNLYFSDIDGSLEAYFISLSGLASSGIPAMKTEGSKLEVVKNGADDRTYEVKYIGDKTAKIELHMDMWMANTSDDNATIVNTIPEGCLFNLNVYKRDGDINTFTETNLRTLPKFRINQHQINISHQYIYVLNPGERIGMKMVSVPTGSNDIGNTTNKTRIRQLDMKVSLISEN